MEDYRHRVGSGVRTLRDSPWKTMPFRERAFAHSSMVLTCRFSDNSEIIQRVHMNAECVYDRSE